MRAVRQPPDLISPDANREDHTVTLRPRFRTGRLSTRSSSDLMGGGAKRFSKVLLLIKTCAPSASGSVLLAFVTWPGRISDWCKQRSAGILPASSLRGRMPAKN